MQLQVFLSLVSLAMTWFGLVPLFKTRLNDMLCIVAVYYDFYSVGVKKHASSMTT